jgi:hypothetical protein
MIKNSKAVKIISLPDGKPIRKGSRGRSKK